MGAEWNLVKSRFWPHFLTNLYIKVMYFSVLYLICRFFLRSVGLYSIKIESIWNICFSCMKIYFEEIFWSLFVTNYWILWIELIRWLWRKRYKNHIITLRVQKLPCHHTNVFISYRILLIFMDKFEICDIHISITQAQF